MVDCSKFLGLLMISSGIVAAYPLQASAETYPEKPIRLICPFSPGGAADMVSRLLSEKLTSAFGHQVIVDNRAGASGNIGVEIAAKSPADGYTALLASSSNFTFAPSLGAKMPYDPERDFAPVALAVMVPNILVANNSLPARSISELIQLAKASPGQITFASPGAGTTSHIIGELFAHKAGIKLLHIPFKGGGPASVALLGGHVQLLFGSISTSLPNIRSGKLRGLGVTSATRSDAAPEIPTIAESGLPGFESTQWWGVYGPAGLPAEIVDRLNIALNKVLRLPEIRKSLAQDSAEPAGGTPAELAAYHKADYEKWGKVIRSAGIKGE